MPRLHRRPPTRAVVSSRLALAAYPVVLTVSAAALLLGLNWLIGRPQSPVGVAIVAIGLPLVSVGLHVLRGLDRELRKPALLIVGVGSVVAAFVLTVGSTASALAGWTAGIVQGFGVNICMYLVVFDVLGALPPDAPDRGARRLRTMHNVMFVVAALLLPLMFARSADTHFWLPMAGWLAGMVCTVVWGAIALIILSGWFARYAMVVAGEPNPWRRSFLRFAADRSVLSYSDGEYRFVHLLVRDHLAAADPAQLAEAVERRRAELAGSVPAPA
jgi:hypothetical protein